VIGHIDHIYLVGHRGTGKTTTAKLAAERLGLEAIDLDQAIESGEGKSCAAIIAGSEERFRQLERDYLARITAEPADKPRIVALGGGFHPVPTDGVCIWLHRDGWREGAAERARLRPGQALSAEVAWMIDEREPRWEQAAHLRLDIPRGRPPERVARDLATYIGWLLELGDSPWAAKTWVVPAGEVQLDRAARDARLFGFAGVEIRSDVVQKRLLTQRTQRTQRGKNLKSSLCVLGDLRVEKSRQPGVLASLRTPEPEWLTGVEASAFDVDVAFVDQVLAAGCLDELEPRRLIVSAHPPRTDDGSDVELVAAAERLADEHPAWAGDLVLKWAPAVSGYAELLDALDRAEQLRERGFELTFLPQGARFGWCRPPLLRQNATNYVPVGLGPHRRKHTDNAVKTPLDLQDWLPHLAGPPPERFEGLVGEPVRASQGDLWHRRAAREEGQPSSYVKIPLGRERSSEELDRLLEACERLDVGALSVTSPLKQAIVDARCVDGDGAVNTLRSFKPGRWQATDTDQAGMRATLRAAEARGVEPGSIAVIGRGGVSPAVLRAIDASDWRLVHHASGRKGWTAEAPGEVVLVVNAAGDSDSVYQKPPTCKVWVDLHYSGVRRPPEGVEVHLNGDVFFDAQAVAQRAWWWGSEGSEGLEGSEGSEGSDGPEH
jgi:shikimate kinase